MNHLCSLLEGLMFSGSYNKRRVLNDVKWKVGALCRIYLDLKNELSDNIHSSARPTITTECQKPPQPPIFAKTGEGMFYQCT